ncbi:MAG: hypothetical protein HQL32_14960, partial [Planctomycetes bacterium]|nr:hypothetical protein [Planctomycetota bacterium]
MLMVSAWGSLLSSLFLGLFMAVQVFRDHERRSEYAYFSLVWFALAILDFLLPTLGSWYEPLRVAWCGLYISGLFVLLGYGISASRQIG